MRPSSHGAALGHSRPVVPLNPMQSGNVTTCLLSCYIRACGHTESSLCKNLGQRCNQESSRTGVKSRHEVERIHTAGNWITVARVYKFFFGSHCCHLRFPTSGSCCSSAVQSVSEFPLYVFSFPPHAPKFCLRVSLFSWTARAL